MSMICPCGSQNPFEQCCSPVIANDAATSAEILMRSRYSAFATGNMQYVYRTYSDAARSALNEADFQSPDSTDWCGLNIVESKTDSVEFMAFFKLDGKLNVLHEKSAFVFENDHWRYHTGEIIQHGLYKHGRNMPCICGSGNKFKRCCGAKFS